MCLVTTEQRDSATSAQNTGRPLRRRASDRVIGGVAAGIGDYLNIDPLLVRAAFVGLMIFGGAGLVLYVGAWLLIPVESRDESIVESVLRRFGMAPGRAIAIVVIVAIALIWLVGLPQGGYVPMGPTGIYMDAGLLIVVALLIVGIVLLRRGGAGRSEAVAVNGVTATAAPPVERTDVVRERRTHVPRGPLGWYALAAALVGIGLLALIDNATDAAVLPGQFFGLALGIIGIGLVIGSWWGNARLLILPALLVLPIAWAASFISVPLEGGTGNVRFAPVTADELRAEYRLMAGELTLDLRELEAGNEPVRIAASVAAGHLLILLPSEARLEIDSRVGAGGFGILDNWQGGTDLTDRFVRGDAGPRFVLDLGAGIGQISVYAMEEGN